MKPRKTKKLTTRSPRKAKATAPAPEAIVKPGVPVAPETVPTVDPVSAGEAEVEASQPDAPVVEGEPTADEPTQEPDPTPEPHVEPEPEASLAGDGVVDLGGVQCAARMMPLDVVLGALSEESLERVDRSLDTDTTAAERKLMLATDGRATPTIFSLPDDDGPPSILHGYESLAAAKLLGRNDIFVIMVPARAVEAAQSHIVEMMQRRNSKDQSQEDEDDLILRIHAHYREAEVPARPPKKG